MRVVLQGGFVVQKMDTKRKKSRSGVVSYPDLFLHIAYGEISGQRMPFINSRFVIFPYSFHTQYGESIPNVFYNLAPDRLLVRHIWQDF